MNSKHALSIISTSLLLAACFGFTSRTAPTTLKLVRSQKSGYAKIKPIITAKCISCHNDKNHPGEVNLATYAKLMKSGDHGAIVVPGHPEKSKLYLYIDGTKKPQMPMGQPPLSKGDLAAVQAWINAGAKA